MCTFTSKSPWSGGVLELAQGTLDSTCVFDMEIHLAVKDNKISSTISY
jgi:hypothetical protein